MLLALLLAGLSAACCSAGGAPAVAAVAEPGPPPPALQGLRPPEAAVAGADTVTEAQMRNVDFHFAPRIVMHIRRLRGQMLRTDPARVVVFDDVRSFALKIESAEVGLAPADLEQLMNGYVFAYEGAPLRAMRFAVHGTQLVQSGVLHKVIDIPFQMTASLSVTPQGLVRIHPTAMKICSLNGLGLMRAVGVKLEDMLDLRKAKGVTVQGNDLLLDPEHLLPPPAVIGHPTAVRVAGGQVVFIYGDTAAAGAGALDLALPDSTDPNYMLFRGGTVRFGKLYMVRTDLMIVDANPADPFDFSIRDYNRQLVAGYTRNLPDYGLESHMPDWHVVTSGGGASPPMPPAAPPARRR